MCAEDQRNGCHQIERPDAGMVQIHIAKPYTDQNSDEVQQIACWQGQGLAIQNTGEFAEGHDGTCGGHRADKDAEEHLDLMNDLLCTDKSCRRCQL